jgi:DHA2 family multidrug resistance protein-like MFS transporter
VTAAAAGTGIAAGWLFTRRQLGRPNPMLDVRLFRVRPFTGAVLVNLLAVFSLVGFLYFVSQHLQLVLGLSPLRAGLVLLPGLAITVAAGFIVVPLARRIPVHLVVSGALLLSAGAYWMVAAAGQGAPAATLAAAFALLGAGVGASETLSNDLILSSVPAAKAGAASAVSETAYEVGSVFGTALLGSILVSSYRRSIDLPAGLAPEQASAASETLGGAVNAAAALPPDTAQALLRSAFHAFDSGVAVTAGIAATLMLAASALACWSLRPSGRP